MRQPDDLDLLYEKLLLEPEEVQPCPPPAGGYNGKHWIGWCWWSSPGGPPDIVYKNSERKLHRIYGPAYISRKYDIEIWYKDGRYHREDGPAITHKNNKVWYYEGKLHRIGGPAIDTKGGPKEYYIHGWKLSPKEYKKEIERRKRKGHYPRVE
jgi:hypothetical protein